MLRQVLTNVLLLFAATVASLGAVELFLRFREEAPLARNAYPPVYGEMWTCWSSNEEGWFPIDLRQSGEAERLREKLMPEKKDELLAELVRTTPFCRDHHPAVRARGPHPERSKGVLVTGDSFAFGIGVDDHETLPARLSEHFPGYNFPNAAWPAQNVTSVMQTVRSAIGRTRITHVLYFYNLNDVEIVPEVQQTESSVIDLQNFWEHRIEELPLWEALAPMRESALARLAIRELIRADVSAQTVRSYRERYFGAANRQNVDRLFHQLGEMNDLLRQNGVGFTVVLYPLLIKRFDGSYEFEDVHELILAECRRREIECVDGTPAFREVRFMRRLQVHRSDFHPNAEAHRRMANYLAEKLRFQEVRRSTSK